ncbi:MAG: pyridoxal phosphate-dependent aminotransferase [Saprospiraceae bacterium]
MMSSVISLQSPSIFSIRTASRLDGIEEYYFSQKLREIATMRADGKAVINLGIGSPDLPPASATVDELTEQSRKPDQHAYQSYAGTPELRKAFAKWYQDWFGVTLHPDKEILPMIGSKEGIMHIAMTYLEAGDEALVPDPGYPTYRAATTLTGANVRSYALSEDRRWLPDLDALAAGDLSRVKLMWVNYPHMPTGAQADRGFFSDLVAFAKAHQILLVNDNPYAFILNERPLSLLSIDGAKEVALELNSLSKSHNMAGWRVGMLAGQANFLQDVLRFKSNMDSGMFKPLQLAAVRALDSPASWYSDLNAIYRGRREKAFVLLDLLNCTYDTNQAGMFVWAKIPAIYSNAYELSDQILYNNHVFLTPGGIFGEQGNQYVRVSLCSDEATFETAIARIV